MICLSSITGWTPGTTRKKIPPSGRPVYSMLLVPRADFFCPLCMQAVLTLADSLNAWPDVSNWCVLVMDSTKESMPPALIQAQFCGWLSAAGLQFQPLMDERGIFYPLAKDGAALLLFSPGSILKHWVLPLSSRELKSARKFVTEQHSSFSPAARQSSGLFHSGPNRSIRAPCSSGN